MCQQLSLKGAMYHTKDRSKWTKLTLKTIARYKLVKEAERNPRSTAKSTSLAENYGKT